LHGITQPCATAVHNQERACRGVITGKQPPIIRFITTLISGLGSVLIGIAVTVVHYSHPTRDSSFRSKQVLATICCGLAVVTNLMVSIDMWTYFSHWQHKVPAFILQV
jgi:hypothetical protein